MKTGKEWFALLPKEVQAKVKRNWENQSQERKNTWDYEMNREEDSLDYWLMGVFVFSKTPEGCDFWWEIIAKYEQK